MLSAVLLLSIPNALAGAPLSPWQNSSLSVATRVADLLSRLDVAEKIGFTLDRQPGVPRLGIPPFQIGNDCLHGVTGANATQFPAPIALAATFDPSLVQRVAHAIAVEARALYNNGSARDISCYGPNINLVRDPRWGRASETYGEDPGLTAALAAAFVRGQQRGKGARARATQIAGTGAGAGEAEGGGEDGEEGYWLASSGCKHLAGYSVEQVDGISRFEFDAVVSKQDLADSYLPAFAACVREDVASIMCAYNALNGTPSCANHALLGGWLRGGGGGRRERTSTSKTSTWPGYVVSDCGALDNLVTAHRTAANASDAAAQALRAGTDVECGSTFESGLAGAIARGAVEEADLDLSLARSLRAGFRLGRFDAPGQRRVNPYAGINTSHVGSDAHAALSLEAARRSIVLAKNDRGQLPLPPRTRVAVIGPQANDTEVILGNYHGTPSAAPVTPLRALAARLPPGSVSFAQGCWVAGEGSWQFEAAIAAAAAADVALVFVGSSSKGSSFAIAPGHAGLLDPATEKESLDRRSLRLPGVQLDLVKAIARRTSTPVVAVLVHGSALDIEFLLQSPRVHAVLLGWYGGPHAGTALADALLGDVSPEARLPITFYAGNYTSQIAMASMSMRAFPGRTHRFLQVPPLLPFGFGLSYTAFKYEVASAPAAVSLAALGSLLGDARPGFVRGGDADAKAAGPAASFTVKVTNTGALDAGDVVLGFLTPPGAGKDGVPLQTLFGFERVHLKAGESTIVHFHLALAEFAPVGVDGTRRALEGTYTAHFGERRSAALGQGYAEHAFGATVVAAP